MHCQSACISSAGPMTLECRRALCNCWSTVAPKHVLPDSFYYCWSVVSSVPKHPMQLPECCGSRACIAEAPFETVGAYFCKKKKRHFVQEGHFHKKKKKRNFFGWGVFALKIYF
ncbi:hypothetical protein AMTRI_Chr06g196790 [Amborella trichopoda]